MEKGINSYGFKVKGDEPPKSYGVEVIIMSSVDLVTEEMKKKRKRPRKYGPDVQVPTVDSFKKKNKFEVKTPEVGVATKEEP